MEHYARKLELRIDWSELDAFGHVNNLAIMKYVQAARTVYLQEVGLMQLQAREKIGPILASITCQFHRALFFPGQVKVYSTVDVIKNTSFRIQHAVYNEGNELSAEAQDIIVYFDFNTQSKLSIPQELREKIEKLETDKSYFP